MSDRTTVLVVGGGPAGMMLGLLLARAGVGVTVLEKHGDFLRDFRGDTVHASTVRLLDELGLGEEFRTLPQSRLGDLELPAPDGTRVRFSNFAAMPEPYNYIAMMPQWDLLDFLADAARAEPTFTLRMNTEATDVLGDGGRVTGVRYRTSAGADGEIHADLTIACDGRRSALRAIAGLPVQEFPVPFDTWWFRLPRHPHERGEAAALLPDLAVGEFLMTFVRDDFYQVGYFTTKGSDARLRTEGVERFRERIARLRPQYGDRTDAIRSVDDLHLLDVRMNRLQRWYSDGLLCIGDAAHAMSPVGGLGINLAIQDAVAAATVLAEPALSRQVTPRVLARVQRRRMFPTVVVQFAQRTLHRVVFGPLLRGERASVPPPLVFLARHVPVFQQLPARLTAYGPRPEHAPEFARRPPRSVQS